LLCSCIDYLGKERKDDGELEGNAPSSQEPDLINHSNKRIKHNDNGDPIIREDDTTDLEMKIRVSGETEIN